MVSICKNCGAFKRTYKSRCRRCGRKKRRQRGRGFKSMFRKVKGTAKKTIKSDITLLGLEHLTELYAKVVSKIKNKKIKKTIFCTFAIM